MRLPLFIIGIVTWHVALISTKDNDTIRFFSDTEDNYDFEARFSPSHRFARSTNYNVTNNRRSEALKAVARSINKFSFDYFKILLKSEREKKLLNNIGCTPISTLLMLSMVAYGAGGETAKQLRRVLALPADDNLAKLGFEILIYQLQLDRNIKLVLRSNIFVDKRISLKQTFIDMALEIFNSDVQSLDFSKRAKAVATIEKSYRPYLNGSNKEHVRKADLDGKTRLVSANIVNLVSRWRIPFRGFKTKNEFYPDNNSKGLKISAMYYTDQPLQYGRIPALRADFVGIPLTHQSPKQATMMYIILPYEVNGLAHVENEIDASLVNNLINSGDFFAVTLTMPKFRIDTNGMIDGLLNKLGLKKMFTKSANFGGILQDSSVPTGPVFAKIVQPVFIDINEKGVGFEPQSAGTLDSKNDQKTIILQNTAKIQFIVDHPFLWIITHNSLRVPLFMGRYTGRPN